MQLCLISAGMGQMRRQYERKTRIRKGCEIGKAI